MSAALRDALREIEALGSDGEHSGDRHARCRAIARAALDKDAALDADRDRLEYEGARLANEFESYCNDLGNPPDSYQRECIARFREHCDPAGDEAAGSRITGVQE